MWRWLKRINAKKSGLNILCVSGIWGSLVSAVVATTPVTLGTMVVTLNKTVMQLAAIISDTALVAGIGFVMASFFKFDAHKKNPTQVPISAPLTLLLIGASLCLFPTIMPLVQTALFGTHAERGAVGGTGLLHLIGNN